MVGSGIQWTYFTETNHQSAIWFWKWLRYIISIQCTMLQFKKENDELEWGIQCLDPQCGYLVASVTGRKSYIWWMCRYHQNDGLDLSVVKHISMFSCLITIVFLPFFLADVLLMLLSCNAAIPKAHMWRVTFNHHPPQHHPKIFPTPIIIQSQKKTVRQSTILVGPGGLELF